MSVYNGEQYLKEAMISITGQTFKEFDFLIMNDGSIDKTSTILKHYADTDNRIEIFEQDNQGLTKSLNNLIDLSKSQYIARMDADDVSHPERLEKQVEYLRVHNDCGVVGTGAMNIDCNGRLIGGYVLPDEHELLLSWLEKGRNVYKHGSIMIRREVLQELNGPYRFKYGQDFDLYLRVSEIAHLGMVQEVLYKYRVVGNAIQERLSTIRKKQILLMLDMHFRRKNGHPEFPWEEKERELLSLLPKSSDKDKIIYSNYSTAISLFQDGRFQEARKYFREAIKDIRFRRNAIFYLLISLFPRKGALYIQEILSRKRDKWAKYRIPRELWEDLNKSFLKI